MSTEADFLAQIALQELSKGCSWLDTSIVQAYYVALP